MQILVNLGGDCLPCKPVEMLRNLIEILPFLNCIAVCCNLIVSILYILEILYEVAELFVFIIVYSVFYYLSDLLSFFSILFIPYVFVFLYQSSEAFLQSFL